MRLILNPTSKGDMRNYPPTIIVVACIPDLFVMGSALFVEA